MFNKKKIKELEEKIRLLTVRVYTIEMDDLRSYKRVYELEELVKSIPVIGKGDLERLINTKFYEMQKHLDDEMLSAKTSSKSVAKKVTKKK